MGEDKLHIGIQKLFAQCVANGIRPLTERFRQWDSLLQAERILIILRVAPHLVDRLEGHPAPDEQPDITLEDITIGNLCFAALGYFPDADCNTQ